MRAEEGHCHCLDSNTLNTLFKILYPTSMGNDVKIMTAKRAGFCFGVKRAVDMAFNTAQNSSNVFTLGPIIHNPQVIERLKSEGVVPISSINEDNIKVLIIRTHGVPHEVLEKLGRKKYRVI